MPWPSQRERQAPIKLNQVAKKQLWGIKRGKVARRSHINTVGFSGKLISKFEHPHRAGVFGE